MAGLAGVTGVHGHHQLPTLVLQALGQLPPVAGQDTAVQACLGLDVRARTVLGAARRLRHIARLQLLDHEGVSLFCQRPADVVRVIGPDPLLPPPQFLQLASNPPRPLPLLAGHLSLQAAQLGHAVHGALTVGDLTHIPVQTQDSRGRAGAHGVRRHRIRQIDVPLGPRPRPFLPDTRLPRLPVGIGVAALEPQPPAARHAQVLGPYLYLLRDGEAILPAMAALEAGISPSALKEGLVRICQVFQNIADLSEAVLLQPSVLGITPQGGEFLAQAEEGDARGLLSFPRLVRRVLLLDAGQKVIPHKPTGARCTGQLLGHLAALRQQAQPHTAVDSLGLGLCYIGRSRHGIQVPCL